jgi:hypothetical protein
MVHKSPRREDHSSIGIGVSPTTHIYQSEVRRSDRRLNRKTMWAPRRSGSRGSEDLKDRSFLGWSSSHVRCRRTLRMRPGGTDHSDQALVGGCRAMLI